MVKTNEDVAFAHESSEIVLWYFISVRMLWEIYYGKDVV